MTTSESSTETAKPAEPTPDAKVVVPARWSRLAAVTAGFRSLRVRNYRLYWVGQVISLTGTWMQTTAQAWLVLQLTNSPFALGLVVTLQFLPITFFSLFGGVLADRLRKLPTIITTQTLLMIQAAVFTALVASNHIQLWHIYVLAMIQGLIAAIDNPVRLAFVVEMVGRDDLLNAIALNSMVFNGARILGPALAGLVIKLIGIAPTLFLNAVSFIPVIIALFMMDPAKLFPPPPATQGSVLAKLKEGLSYAWRTPSILLVLIVVGAIGTFGYNFSVVIPLLAYNVLKTDEFGFGLLGSFLGLGSLVGAISTAYMRKVNLHNLFIGSGAFSIIFGLVALSQSFWLSGLLLIVLGFSGIIFSTTSNTLLQLYTSDELRGRVMSINVLLFAGSTPIGGFLVGTLSQLLSVSVALLVCAVLCLTGVIIAVAYQRKIDEKVESA